RCKTRGEETFTPSIGMFSDLSVRRRFEEFDTTSTKLQKGSTGSQAFDGILINDARSKALFETRRGLRAIRYNNLNAIESFEHEFALSIETKRHRVTEKTRYRKLKYVPAICLNPSALLK